jgi:hypothetical protein
LGPDRWTYEEPDSYAPGFTGHQLSITPLSISKAGALATPPDFLQPVEQATPCTSYEQEPGNPANIAPRRTPMQFAMLIWRTPEEFAMRNNEYNDPHLGAWQA